MNFGLMDIGLPELIIVLVILLLLFGAKQLPKLSRSLGQSAKELRDGFNGRENNNSAKDEDKDQENKT